jgi:hypothetical protein
MKNESIKKSAKTDRMRIKIRSVTVGSAALVILLSIFQQAAAQTNSYTSMLNTISNANQAFWTQQNSYNNNLYRMSHGNSYQAPATPRHYPITATDFRPIFQWMAPDLVANSQPGLTPEQKEGLKAFANQTLTEFEARYRKNNVAIAMTYLFSVSYMVNTGHSLSGTECDQWTMAFNNALAANVDFITMSPRDKQLEYEQAVVIGGMIAFLNEQENPAQQSAAREMARTTLRNLGFNAR